MAKEKKKTHGGKREGSGRPAKFLDGLVKVTVKIPVALKEEIESEAIRRGVKPSVVIRERLSAKRET